jgi:hypothetical protein
MECGFNENKKIIFFFNKIVDVIKKQHQQTTPTLPAKNENK